MADNSCCAAGTWPQPPRREPSVWCVDQQRGGGGFWLYIDPMAHLLLMRFGINPCSVPQAGGDDHLRRQDVEGYLEQHHYIG